jgi:7-cyano-7-deazaguanine synthase
MTKAVVVISGGLDSSTLAHLAAHRGHDVYGISFDYGQRHAKELHFAAYQLATLQAEHHVVDMTFLKDLFAESGSALVTDTDVPEGHYAESNMKATIVPNRNMIMLSIAAGYAVSIGAVTLWTGVHAGDHAIYPDCRPEFIHSINGTIVLGNEGFNPPILETPFLYKSKNDIAQMAFDLNVDIAKTWSCYKGGDVHCGKCGTCVERLEAIASTGNADPTAYADDKFWLEALKRETV